MSEILWDLVTAGLLIAAMVIIGLGALWLFAWLIEKWILPRHKALTEAQAREAVKPLSSTVDVHRSSNGRRREEHSPLS